MHGRRPKHSSAVHLAVQILVVMQLRWAYSLGGQLSLCNTARYTTAEFACVQCEGCTQLGKTRVYLNHDRQVRLHEVPHKLLVTEVIFV